MDKYYVVYVDRYAFGFIGPVMVHAEPGETTKDVQDKIAANQAMRFPHLIYTVMLAEDYHEHYKQILRPWGLAS